MRTYKVSCSDPPLLYEVRCHRLFLLCQVTIGHGMDSSIDESDLGSLDVPVTGRRTSRRSRGMRVCLLLAAFLVHPALRSPLTDEVAGI